MTAHMLIIGRIDQAPLMRAEELARETRSTAETDDCAAILRCVGQQEPRGGNVSIRAPHHTVSLRGMIGDAPHPRTRIPRFGELSLAHGGVLIMDQADDFRPDVTRAIIHAATHGVVRHSRGGAACEYPARFRLIATAYPCLCGFRGSQTRECRCTRDSIARHEARLVPIREICAVEVLP